MSVEIAGQVGPQVVMDGVVAALRLGKSAEAIMQELHGRFFEQAYRGNLYSTGMGVTALSANTITLTATTTPILGVWNPPTSPVNLVILQAMVNWFLNTFTTPADLGAFVWASSVSNGALSAGSTPFNRKTLAQAGSYAKAFPLSPALTGLSNNLVVFEGADIPSAGAVAFGTFPGTAVVPFGGGVQNVDGSIIVPPGGVLALLNTTSTTAISVAGRLLWEEVPV